MFVLLLLAGCAQPVSNIAASAPPTPAVIGPPTRVLVAVFTPAPGMLVQLDSSPGAQVQRQAAGLSAEAAQAKDVQDVQNAIADTLVQKIQAMGLPALRVPPNTQPSPADLLITGQITAIDEGSRARRTVIGFGAGKSAVLGTAELLRGSAAGPQLLQSYDANANSGRMPGLGVGAAASGAKSAVTVISAGAHAAGEVNRTPVEDQAVSVAKKLAGDLHDYFVSQSWVTGQ